MNLNCSIKYCSVCKKRLRQTYSREENNHLVRTRKCPECGQNIRTVEISLEQYNESVKKLNQIIDVLSAGEG